MAVVSQVLRPAGAPQPTFRFRPSAFRHKMTTFASAERTMARWFATTLGAPVLVDVTRRRNAREVYRFARLSIQTTPTRLTSFSRQRHFRETCLKGNLAGFPIVTLTALDGASLPRYFGQRDGCRSLNSIISTSEQIAEFIFTTPAPQVRTWTLYGNGCRTSKFRFGVQSPFRFCARQLTGADSTKCRLRFG